MVAISADREAIEQLKGCMYDLYESLCNERPIDFITLFDI